MGKLPLIRTILCRHLLAICNCDCLVWCHSNIFRPDLSIEGSNVVYYHHLFLGGNVIVQLYVVALFTLTRWCPVLAIYLGDMVSRTDETS